MRKITNIYIYFFVLITLIACSSIPEKNPTEVVAPTSTSTASVLPFTSPVTGVSNNVVSPVQTPVSATSIPDRKIAVTGAIFLVQNGEKYPYTGAILYLAKTIVDSNGNESFIAMDRINSPRTIADENGQFIFSDVPEGNYGLVLDVIRDSYFLHYPETNEPILVSINDDKPVDLGELVFDNLPVSIK